MINLPLSELYLMRERIIKENLDDNSLMSEVMESINLKERMLFEDTSATGGPVVSGGMGAVVSAQPSTLSGTTVGSSWSDNGGTVGSGDVSFPFNTGAAKTVYTKAPMGKNHGSRTGKKSREKKLDMKALKDIFSKRQDFTNNQTDGSKGKRVMNFNDFLQDDITKIKK
jgi:hypothetical protein